MAIMSAFALCGCMTTVGEGVLDLERTIVAKIDTIEDGSETAAYVLFDNNGPADRLLGVSCDCADRIEIHHLVGEGDAREMVHEPYFDISAHAVSAIEPPGLQWHLMLRDVRRAIPEGSTVRMTLTFERAGARIVEFRAVDGTRKAWDALAD